MRRRQRTPRPPALGEIAEAGGRVRGVALERAPEAEIGGREGVRLAEPEREVVRSPGAEAVHRGDRGDEPVEADAAIEADGVVGDGPGEEADRALPARA